MLQVLVTYEEGKLECGIYGIVVPVLYKQQEMIFFFSKGKCKR